MKMKEQLEYFIRQNVKNPRSEEIKDILNIFHKKSYKKGEYFKQYHQVFDKIGFIVEGIARYYFIKDNGNDITGRIIQKNNFISDLTSLRTRSRIPISVVFFQPTSVLVSTNKEFRDLLEVNLTLNIFIREYMTDNIVEMEKMRMLFLTGSAKDRYKFILENIQDLLNKIQLRFIA
jgi:CRP-like cAMP-binding protein